VIVPMSTALDERVRATLLALEVSALRIAAEQEAKGSENRSVDGSWTESTLQLYAERGRRFRTDSPTMDLNDVSDADFAGSRVGPTSTIRGRDVS